MYITACNVQQSYLNGTGLPRVRLEALFSHIEGENASTQTNGLCQALGQATHQSWSPSPVYGDISQNNLNNQSGYGLGILLERQLGQEARSLVSMMYELLPQEQTKTRF